VDELDLAPLQPLVNGLDVVRLEVQLAVVGSGCDGEAVRLPQQPLEVRFQMDREIPLEPDVLAEVHVDLLPEDLFVELPRAGHVLDDDERADEPEHRVPSRVCAVHGADPHASSAPCEVRTRTRWHG